MSEDVLELWIRPQQLAALDRRLSGEGAECGMPKNGFGTDSCSAAPSD